MQQKLLVIVVGENDRFEGVPLYEAIVRKLMQLSVPGANVQRGIMGFGRHHTRLHHERLFGVVDDRPVTISVVHDEAALRDSVIPAVRTMLRHELMFLSDVEMV